MDTTDPNYYKWTQWIFLQLFKHGLAYKTTMPVNWCTSCKCVLANEEVVEGVCERCGSEVIRKEKSQWMLKITAYAQRLIDDLDDVDYHRAREDPAAQLDRPLHRCRGHLQDQHGRLTSPCTPPVPTLCSAPPIWSFLPEHPLLKEWQRPHQELGRGGRLSGGSRLASPTLSAAS